MTEEPDEESIDDMPLREPEEQGTAERIFETALWNSRFIVLLAVIFGLVCAVTLFLYGSWDILKVLFEGPGEKGSIKVVGAFIGAIDLFLIGVVFLIFSFGIYELFISRIDIGRRNKEVRILEITNLDDLKNRIIKVVIMVLVVTFFKRVQDVEFSTSLDMLYFAISIFAISFGVYFMHKSE